MSAQEWGIVIGVVMSAMLALGPWMFMVHAKLAVLASQMVNLDDKVDRLIDRNEERQPWCYEHETQLRTHEVQISQIGRRLREME